jgi:hypothetical protein
MKTSSKIGKVTSINLVDDTTEMIVISQFGKIIRIDTKSVRSAGHSTSGVRLLNLGTDDTLVKRLTPPGTTTPLISVFRLVKGDNALMILVFVDPDGKISNFRFLPNREYQ